MSDRKGYTPGPAGGIDVHEGGERWTLVLVRDLRHPPARVWAALTEPAHLLEWAPFDADRSLAAAGVVTLTPVGAPADQAAEAVVRRAEAPRLLEFTWSGSTLRWELEPLDGGTRLTLWHDIDRRYVAWGAAGWHVCVDVLDRLLAGAPIGRIAGAEAMQFEGWRRLTEEYARRFGLDGGGA